MHKYADELIDYNTVYLEKLDLKDDAQHDIEMLEKARFREGKKFFMIAPDLDESKLFLSLLSLAGLP